MRALVAILFALAGTAAAETHPFSIHDMLAMQRISDAQVSADGKWVLHGLRTTDLDANVLVAGTDIGDTGVLSTISSPLTHGNYSVSGTEIVDGFPSYSPILSRI